ncbi:IS1/IS1595 family N-terminal zinc-binding domain-containing protein [Rurimicrobium arvi]|uniref:Terminase ATPase subunit N-terminal domain-containing protein n=1 Tax=Rurimicrobium arvi TaxID=2049916 RepID=A0ABP8MRP3_9BACT
MNCPKCSSGHNTRNGIVNGLQRFKCKSCGYNFTVEKKSSLIDINTKRLAVILYLEGLRVTTIAQMLRVSHVSVINWIRKYCNHVDELRGKGTPSLHEEAGALQEYTLTALPEVLQKE